MVDKEQQQLAEGDIGGQELRPSSANEHFLERSSLVRSFRLGSWVEEVVKVNVKPICV